MRTILHESGLYKVQPNKLIPNFVNHKGYNYGTTIDFLVIGSGIAGMSLALKVADKGKVAIICKTELEEANTYFAQGGIASVTNLLVDNFDKHIEDTMIAGDWISKPCRSRKSSARSSRTN